MECFGAKTINKYLPLLEVKRKKIELKGLPLMYRNLYRFDKLIINEKPYLAVSVKGKDGGPRQFKKHSQILSEKTSYPLIWCMHELHFHKIQRLIENGINFVIEDKQVHLPSVNVSIKNENTRLKTKQTELSGLSVNILITEILKGNLSGKNKLELADKFSVTQMTMGRAIEPLISNGFCHEKKEGVSKLVFFNNKPELWDTLKKTVNTPVKEVIYIDKKPNKSPYSGISALSKMTMLADDEIPTYALSKKHYKNTLTTKDVAFNPVIKEFAKAKLEIWNREPLLIKKGAINPIDVFLILKYVENERVQLEPAALLSQYGLEIGTDND